jgi:exodeoxyribonuclease VII large subunit
MSDERQIFTLKQVTNSIQKVIGDRYPKNYWVQTEIHKLNYTSKGHCYPELVHKENGQVLAEMRATIWASNFDKINKNFAQVVKEPIRDGMVLLVLAKIVFHPLYGISLEIIDVDPTYSLGELQKERDETLKKLNAEGVLNNNQKLKFPLLPKRIALISQESSKGLKDFYSIIENNPWNYNFFFMLFPAQLNGDLAIHSIQAQLEKINKVKHYFDLVLIIRGGGGEIGLSCFNNYHLAKKIATFPLPIMTGIGHSTNITVSELVAFRNAITPTELADFLIQAYHDFNLPLQEAVRVIKNKSKNLIELKQKELKNEIRFLLKSNQVYILNEKNSLKNEMKEIKTLSLEYLKENKYVLKNQFLDFNRLIKNKININKTNLSQKQIELNKNFRNYLQQTTQNNKKWIEDFQKIIKLKLESQNKKIDLFENSIRLINPENVLKRGYSISLKNGKLISAQNPIFEGDLIETITEEFKIKSTIKNIDKNE